MESGGKKPLKWYLKSDQTDRQTDTQTDISTYRKNWRRGPFNCCLWNQINILANIVIILLDGHCTNLSGQIVACLTACTRVSLVHQQTKKIPPQLYWSHWCFGQFSIKHWLVPLFCNRIEGAQKSKITVFK